MIGRPSNSAYSAAVAAVVSLACAGTSSDGSYPAALPVESRVLPPLPGGIIVREGGYGSALAAHPARAGYFYMLADRGPNVDTSRRGQKRFVIPTFTPRLGLFKVGTKSLSRIAVIELKDASGHPLSGIPNPGPAERNESAVDLGGARIEPDANGIDPEGLVALRDGTFWISDEYGPHLLHVDAGGRTLERISPGVRNRQGHALPRVLSMRRPNRGMEGLTLTPDGRALVGLMQSALDNPSRSVRGRARAARVVVLDRASGRAKQLVYLLEEPGFSVSEIAALSSTKFLVLERDDGFADDPKAPARCKRIYRIDTREATDVSDPADGVTGKLFAGRTLEQLSDEQLRAAGVVPVAKTLALDLLKLPGGYPHDKPEGLAILENRWVAVSNDDDFDVTNAEDGSVAQKILPGPGQTIDWNEVRFIRPR